MEWNDLLLLGMEVYNGQATVIYCSPNQYIGVATVPVDDIISGTAHIVPPRSDKSISRAIRKERQFYTGINPIGTFDAGPLEPIDPSEYPRLQEERDRIRDEYRESQLGK
jgi:hypothetical protein